RSSHLGISAALSLTLGFGRCPQPRGNNFKENSVNIRLIPLFLSLLAALTLTACGSSSDSEPVPTPTPTPEPTPEEPGDDELEVPSTYTFPNADDVSTVSYTGQTKRHILIEDLVVAMNNLTEE